jgi:ABC-type sugar transport system ATPase subunit
MTLVNSSIAADISLKNRPVMEVRNIYKRFPGVIACNNISLEFLPGEVHAVVGENGAGKSTLMKIMAGAYTSDSGDLILHGEHVSFSHPQEAQLKGVSIIYQEFNLLPERTVAQNIFLGTREVRHFERCRIEQERGRGSQGSGSRSDDQSHRDVPHTLRRRTTDRGDCESHFL